MAITEKYIITCDICGKETPTEEATFRFSHDRSWFKRKGLNLGVTFLCDSCALIIGDAIKDAIKKIKCSPPVEQRLTVVQ